jgi:hypothetical protein
MVYLLWACAAWLAGLLTVVVAEAVLSVQEGKRP